MHDSAKKLEALDIFMDKIAVGRKEEARRGNSKEIAATTILRISLTEVAVKISDSAPSDKVEDIDLPVWAGILPMKMTRGSPVHTESNKDVTVPDYVKTWAD